MDLLIPQNILSNKKLSIPIKFVYAAILNIVITEKICLKTNKFFKKEYNIPMRTTTRAVAILIKKKYIKSKVRTIDHKTVRKLTILTKSHISQGRKYLKK